VAKYNFENLREIRKVYFLVHPYWGLYGPGGIKYDRKGSAFWYDPMPEVQLYADKLEHEWRSRDLPEILKQKEVMAKAKKIREQVNNEELDESLGYKRFEQFLGKYLRKATPQDVEAYAKRAGKLYRKAIADAKRKRDSLFIIISNASVDIGAEVNKHSRQVRQRAYEYDLLKHAKKELGKRAVIIQERVKPAYIFRLITGRGFRLTKNLEIEAFGEIAKGWSKEVKACVPRLFNEFIKSIPRMQKYVARGNISKRREKPPPELVFSANTGQAFVQHKGGKREPLTGMPVPKYIRVSHRKPAKKRGRPFYWINLSHSGIPLPRMKSFASRLSRARR